MTCCTYHAQQNDHRSQVEPTDPITEMPDGEEERAILRSRVFTAFSGVAMNFKEFGLMVSDETVAELAERLDILESLVLVWLLFLLQVRGASAADCEQYAAISDGDLPLQGTEQVMFDTVLGSLNAQPGTIPARDLVAAAASAAERVLQHVVRHSGVSLAVMCALMDLEIKHV